jgi:hypothetical protein
VATVSRTQPRIDIEAIRIAPRARRWLRTRRRLRYLHIFDHVCNLVDEDGAVLSVQTERLPPAPISLVLAERSIRGAGLGRFSAWLEPAAPLALVDGGLRLGPIVVNWGAAETWDPRPDWRRLRAAGDRWRRRLSRMSALLRSEAPGGLAPLLDEATIPAELPVVSERVVAAARDPARRVISGLRAGEIAVAAEGARALAGLGGGLTPSGDDFLIGVMHALWATWPEAASRQSSQPLAAAAIPRTSTLSAAWLSAAAAGEVAGHWHELLDAMLDGEGAEVDAATRRLLQVGHSSGADALAGFVGMLTETALTAGSGPG